VNEEEEAKAAQKERKKEAAHRKRESARHKKSNAFCDVEESWTKIQARRNAAANTEKESNDMWPASKEVSTYPEHEGGK
jgi:hypothetical protein